jgi:hypothetical protein
MCGTVIKATPRMNGIECVSVLWPNRRSILAEIKGNVFPIMLACVSMSGRSDETAITKAFTRLRETPNVVRMRR